MRKRLGITVGGRVQGVFFRAATRAEARALGLAGWVRNLPDGRVEAVFEGEEEALRSIAAWCRRGPPGARVDELSERWDEAKGGFEGFEVRF